MSTTTLAQWPKDLRKAADSGIVQAVRGALEKTGIDHARRSSALAPRATGRLAARIRSKVTVKRSAITLDVGPGRLRYAGIQETGGVIRPKRKQYLYVPVGEGVTKETARGRVVADGGTLTVKRDTHVIKSRNGNLVVLFGGKVVAVLVRSVRIPGVGYLRRGADVEGAKSQIIDRVAKAIAKGTA